MVLQAEQSSRRIIAPGFLNKTGTMWFIATNLMNAIRFGSVTCKNAEVENKAFNEAFNNG